MSSSITSQPLNNNIAMSLYDIDKVKSIKLACLAVGIIGGSRPGHCWGKILVSCAYCFAWKLSCDIVGPILLPAWVNWQL